MTRSEPTRLLGAADVRRLAESIGLRPTKSRGQNFVVDANTVRRIARRSGVGPSDVVLEVGPGLGSLTLALLETGASVTAVEVDEALAAALPGTVSTYAPDDASRLRVLAADALAVTELPGGPPDALVANLPYNVSVPVVLRVLQRWPSVTRALVMVQLEVAERLAAAPGSKVYGVPSAKAAWYGSVRLAGTVPRSVFWPVPNVDSGLVEIVRGQSPGPQSLRSDVFACVDAAFAQRRKTLRAALAGWAGSADGAERLLTAAGIDPRQRGEQLSIAEFTALASAKLADLAVSS